MSNSDFEDRLNRIRAGAGQQTPSPTPSEGKKGVSLRGLVLGLITFTAGSQLIKVTNTNYELIRDQYGFAASLGLGLGSIAIMILGSVLTIRAILGLRSARAGQQASAPSSGHGKGGMRYGRLILGALAMSAGGQMIKVTNANYESIRDQYGIPAAAGLGLGSFALLIFGIVLLIGAFLPARSRSSAHSSLSYPTSGTRPQVQTSPGARLFFSLLGLGLGALACFILFVGSALTAPQFAAQFDTETPLLVFQISFIIAALLTILAILISFVGLFVSRLPLQRVLVFFFLGAMLLFTGFNALRIHPANWPLFLAELTNLLKNLTVE